MTDGFWNGKQVWVTGASSGIGEAFARHVAYRGAHLVLSSRRADALHTLAASLPNAESHKILTLDVAQPAELAKILAENSALLQKTEVLFANAGISQRATAWETSADTERALLECNFFGSVAVAKAALVGMRLRGSGHIAVMSSASGKFGFALRSSYAASKHALHGYFDSLRIELKDTTIGVSLICPGRIRTNISLNALTANGQPHNTLDPGQAAGISAEVCAATVAHAIERGRAEVYIGKEQALIYLSRFWPALFRTIVKRINPT